MSFLFFILSVVTLWLSHYWANKTQPMLLGDFSWTKNFKGSKEKFCKTIEKIINENSNLLLLEKTPSKFIISESPSLFEFGQFYHISIKEKDNQLTVKLVVQPKLVSEDQNKTQTLIKQIENTYVS